MKYVYPMNANIEKVGIAGAGSLGGIVANALKNGLDGYMLHAISDHAPKTDFGVPNVDFQTLAKECDVIVECLPAAAVPDLVKAVLDEGKTLIMITAAALVLFPEIQKMASEGKGKILVPSGALSGLDAVTGLATQTITDAKIISTKPPAGFKNNAYLSEKKINIDDIKTPTMIFSGTVNEAAKHFPANVNVAASLALAGIGFEKTRAEIWADPTVKTNAHEIVVSGPSSVIRSKIENTPDPANPKSSMQAAYSIIAALKKRRANLTIF